MHIPPHLIKKWVGRHFDYKTRVGKNGEELVIPNPFYEVMNGLDL